MFRTVLVRTILLLADVFENFRKVCLEIYELGPEKFLSAPEIIWQAALTLFRVGFFGGCSRIGVGGQKGPPSLKSVTHILQWWNLAQLYLTQRRSKKYMNHATHLLSSADISIFSPGINKFCYTRNTDIDCFLIHNFHLF